MKGHLDLQVWLIWFSTKMSDIASALGKTQDESMYQQIRLTLSGVLENRLYDTKAGIFNDFAGEQPLMIRKNGHMVPNFFWRTDGLCGPKNLNPLGTSGVCDPFGTNNCCNTEGKCGTGSDYCDCQGCTQGPRWTTEVIAKMKKSLQFSVHRGYVTLFPLMFGLLPQSDERFQALVDMLKDSKELLSNYGVRSLSASDLLYKTGADYWRSPIWINMNYLVLRGLREYYLDSDQTGELQELYEELKENLLINIANILEESGELWEQYNDLTGIGQHSHPFTGWTVLVLPILADDYFK